MTNRSSFRGGFWILFSAALAAFLVSHSAPAQQFGRTYSASAQTTAALNSLSPDAQRVMDRLNKLSELPVADLKYHTGDVPRGAAPDLDDSSWQTITLPYRASTDVVWLRKWIEVPKVLNGYDLTGSRISFRGPTRGAEAVYLNGERAARGEDMEPFILFKIGRASCRERVC